MERREPFDVDAYISSAGVDARPILEELRRIIKSLFPEAEERISWGVPFYWYRGPLCGYAAFKTHVSFGCDVIPQRVRARLEGKGYRVGKKTVRIRLDQRVPAQEIREILLSLKRSRV